MFLVHIQHALALASVLLDNLIVHLHYLCDTADLEWQFVLLGELLDHRANLGIVVSGHRGEQMMLELILHASEKVLGQKVVAVNPSCRGEVVRHVAVSRILGDDVLCLMVAGHDDGNQEASDEDSCNRDERWQGSQPDVAKANDSNLSPVLSTNSKLYTLHPPGNMEERVGDGIVDVLILAIPSIGVRLREPEMDDGLVVNININIKTIREDMMGVVLVAPPL